MKMCIELATKVSRLLGELGNASFDAWGANASKIPY
jgi:hypothetical protein